MHKNYISIMFKQEFLNLYVQNKWSQPEIKGDLVTGRAGHAGITIDGNWYIVGGGDNNNGM